MKKYLLVLVACGLSALAVNAQCPNCAKVTVTFTPPTTQYVAPVPVQTVPVYRDVPVYRTVPVQTVPVYRTVPVTTYQAVPVQAVPVLAVPVRTGWYPGKVLGSVLGCN